MMKTSSGLGRWGPAAGVLAVALMAFSLSLEGAAPSPQKPSAMKDKVIDESAPAVVEGREQPRIGAEEKQNVQSSGGARTPLNFEMEVPEGVKFGRLPSKELPIYETMVVDYRDDAGSQLRNAGLLVGPYRPTQGEGAVAAGTCPPTPGSLCSFDIQCDDQNPCTQDFCDIDVGDPLGTGQCTMTVLANGARGGCSDGLCCNGLETCQAGVCQAPGLGNGTFDPGECQYPCGAASCVGGPAAGAKCAEAADCRVCVGGTNNGLPCTSAGNCPGGGSCPAGGTCTGPALVCNEDSNLCRRGCTGAGTCSITGHVCTSTNDCIPPVVAAAPEGNYCMNCNDGVVCNGTETCANPGATTGTCESGTNPCGPGGVCGEKDCTGPGFTVCTTDSDCGGELGTCDVNGPICFTGRCCNPGVTPETGCTKRMQTKNLCNNAGPVALRGSQCLVNADCGAGGTCGANDATRSCANSQVNGGLGRWFASDDGSLGTAAGGTACPSFPAEDPPNDRTLCPKYSSGIAPAINFDTDVAFLVGPFSQGPCDHSEVGDDYEFDNTNTFINLEKFRWVGAAGGRLGIEFYDQNLNFIEDVITGAVGGGLGVRSLQFLPPLVIPSKGYVKIRVAPNFAPNGATFVAVANSVQEGVNTAQLLLDGAVTNTLVRECVGGINDGIWCDPADAGTNNLDCTASGGVCTNRTNTLAFELEGLKTPGPAGACCDTDSPGVCTNGVLPWVCTGQGDNFQGPSSTCAGSNCGIGACCTTGGTCSVIAAGSCTGGSVFQGFGTDCDPNCCAQPTANRRGRDNCAQVVPWNIHVPDPGEEPVVVTITGNNLTASGPDTCLQSTWNAVGGTYLTVDPGWWEAFHIDDCALVRVDWCCSDPVVEPQWATIWEGCPCDDQRFVDVDPNKPQEPGSKRGTPYCPDDNLWTKYGPLPGDECRGGPNDGDACTLDSQCKVCTAGQNAGLACTLPSDCPGGQCPDARCAGIYYVPIYSVPPGHHGQYQMHITVEGCPVAACCNGTSCVETDQLGCAAINGANFLAPPFRTNATTSCIDDGPGGLPDTCGTGSCCYSTSGNLCEDVSLGQLMTPAACTSIAGQYKGGARCLGCVCAAGNPPRACNDDGDCGIDGPCNNPQGGGVCSGQDLLQPPPCPVCDFESISRCQRLPSNRFINARLSDECVGNCVSEPAETQFSIPGIRAADDFVATTGGNITSVCVWGSFLQQGGIGLPDCGDSGPPEKFTVTLYNDANGLPGTSVGTRSTTVTRKGLTSANPPAAREVFQWQLLLSAPLAVSPGQTYWLEVVNDTDESTGHPECDWFWALSDPDLGGDSGNQIIFQDAGTTYSFGDAAFDGADLAWCITIDNTVPTIKQAACCTCGGGIGSCSVQSLENCTNADGSWRPTEDDCIGMATACRNVADAADSCLTQAVTVGTLSNTTWNNYCTNTDGPIMAGNDDCAGLPPDSFQNDLWYKWTAPIDCDVVIETCDLGGEIDTLMAIYTDNTGTCPCPTSVSNETNCNNEGCVFVGAGSRITLPAVGGVCYTIRIGGLLGVKGDGVLHVGNCTDEPEPPLAPLAELNGVNKTRFVSFQMPNAATAGPGVENAIRIVLSTLHVVVPPYTGAPTVPFSAFNGQSVYVGPPSTYTENGDPGGLQFKAAFTTCTPHYQNWGTVGLLHVTGPQIVPSSIYKVESLDATCEGVEGTAACLTGGGKVSAQLEIRTTRWGDVASLYNPPDPSIQPDISDVSNLVDKFRNTPTALIKARGLQAGIAGNAWGQMDASVIAVPFGFGHISACVDAYRGAAYPFKMGKCAGAPTPPATGACTANSECTGTNGAGPCNLYCP